MLILLSKLIGLFSLNSKKTLFAAIGVASILILAMPVIIHPAIKSISIRSRLNLIVKLNSVDRAKLKEPALKKSYDSLLADYAKKEDTISIEKAKKFGKVTDFLKPDNVKTFIAGSILWVLLGIVGLFVFSAKVPIRMGTFLLFCLIGVLCGIVAVSVPAIEPFPVFALCILAVEVVFMSIIGTMVKELNKNG